VTRPAAAAHPTDAQPPRLRVHGAPYTAIHAVLRTEVRGWLAEHVTPHVEQWEAAREFPRELFSAAGAAGLLGWKYGPDYGGRGPDLLADMVISEELACCGSGGVAAGLGATKDLAPYYLARYGGPAQRGRWLAPAVRGDQVAALAVTEPGAGSDVAALRCRAVPDGDGWSLSGSKCFITNGCRADWVLVAARTADTTGWQGVSLLIVPTGAGGFTADRIHTLGWATSQTGLLHLDQVRVGPEALLGEPGAGFAMIMQSFQWERVALAVAAVAAAADDLDRVAAWGVDDSWWQLARRLASARALAYAALSETVAGRDAVPAVSAAKWLACDLAVDTAAHRFAAAQRVSAHEARLAERALRDARLGPIGGGAREVMAELVARSLPLA
jgi:acyl-CoA dehydrogenase